METEASPMDVPLPVLRALVRPDVAPGSSRLLLNGRMVRLVCLQVHEGGKAKKKKARGGARAR